MPDDSKPMHWSLKDGGELTLFPQFIPVAERAQLFAGLRDALPWQSREIRVAGRLVREPRLTAWVGDPAAVYTYSGRRNEPMPWPELLVPLRERISQTAREEMNSVLANLYRDGRDSMGFHADKERELGIDPVIASLSLGATRRFQLRHRSDRDARLDLDLDLGDGSLLVMAGTLQHHFRHGVPKQPGVLAPRINLTFRRVRAPSA
ncbi:MAG TPA: alpha-ketoglutarate-dependent dioxygenase AlkB [Polyangiales bacterium]|jgi:alkylated DNA repair dioxygenase AlkB